MRFWKIDLASRGTQLYYRGVGLSAVGVLLFLIGVLALSGLVDFGAGGLAMAIVSIAGAGAVMIGFAVMTAACCGLDLKACEWETAGARREISEAAAIVRVRCRSCRALNEESAAACDQCGEAL